MAKKDDAKAQAKDSKPESSKAAEAKPADAKAGASKDASKEKAKPAEENSSFNLSEFLQGTKEELDKVVWPSRQQLISESVAVILMVTLSATIIYLVDNLFSWAASRVF